MNERLGIKKKKKKKADEESSVYKYSSIVFSSAGRPCRYCSKWQIFAILSIIIRAKKIVNKHEASLNLIDGHFIAGRLSPERKTKKKENPEPLWIVHTTGTFDPQSIKTRCLRERTDFLPTVSRFFNRESKLRLNFHTSRGKRSRRKVNEGGKRKSV